MKGYGLAQPKELHKSHNAGGRYGRSKKQFFFTKNNRIENWLKQARKYLNVKQP